MSVFSFQHIAPALRLFHGTSCLDQLPRELVRRNVQRDAILGGASLDQAPALLRRVQLALGYRFVGAYAGVRAQSPEPAVESCAS